MTRTAGTSTTHTSTRHMQAFVVAVAAIVTAWILVRTWHGPRITGDSALYISAAENLADGKGLVTYRHRPVTHHYAPGYSVVLAAPELLGASAREASRWLNAGLAGATILVVGMWLRSVCRFRMPLAVAVLTAACIPVWHSVASAHASDTLYLFLTVSSLALVANWLRTSPRSGIWLLVAAAALAGASAATRYIGVVLIASTAAVILVAASQPLPRAVRLRLAVLYGLVASLPVTVVLAFNLSSSGTPAGNWPVTFDRIGSLPASLRKVAESQFTLQFAVVWVILAAALLIGFAAGDRPGPAWLRPDRTLPFAAFAVAYAATLALTRSLTGLEIQDRYVLPAWLALLVVGCELLDKALGGLTDRIPERQRPVWLRLAVLGASAVIVLGLGNSLRFNLNETDHALRLGIPAGEYSGDDAGIRESDVFDYLQANPIDEEVYTNRPHALYWLGGMQPVQGIPRRLRTQCADWFRETQPTVIVWFDHLRPNDLFQLRPDEAVGPRCDIPSIAAQLPELKLVQRTDDGAIYRADHPETGTES